MNYEPVLLESMLPEVWALILDGFDCAVLSMTSRGNRRAVQAGMTLMRRRIPLLVAAAERGYQPFLAWYFGKYGQLFNDHDYRIGRRVCLAAARTGHAECALLAYGIGFPGVSTAFAEIKEIFLSRRGALQLYPIETWRVLGNAGILDSFAAPLHEVRSRKPRVSGFTGPQWSRKDIEFIRPALPPSLYWLIGE